MPDRSKIGEVGMALHGIREMLVGANPAADFLRVTK